MRQLIKIGLVTICALSTGLALTSGAPQTGGAATRQVSALDIPVSQVHNREILVQLDSSRATKSVSAFCKATGVVHQRSLDLSFADYQIVRVPEGQDYNTVLHQLAANPQVKSVGPNAIKVASEFIPDDPLFLGSADNLAEALQMPAAQNNQWALIQCRAPEAWDVTTGESSVIVAVLDTGVNFDSEDLQGRLWVNADEIAGNSIDDDGNGFVDDRNGWDFDGWNGTSGGDNDPSDPSTADVAHGNATTSIVCARGNNGRGISGVAGGDSASNGCRVMPLRVGTDTNITVDAEIGAIDYAINNGAKIISMSFGGASGGAPEENAVNAAWNAGLLVVAASGNIGQGNEDGEGNPLVDLPAGFTNCMAVAASTIFNSQLVTGSTTIVSERIANYSKQGPEVDITAPGTHIMAAANEAAGYTNSVSREFTGTSAATPIVAGLAALIWSASPSLTNAQVRSALENNAEDLGTAGFDNAFGHGRIDMAASLPAAPGKEGDTNGDGQVTEADVQPIIDHFGAHSGDANYDAKADCNNDGVIDELDLFIVGRKFGS